MEQKRQKGEHSVCMRSGEWGNAGAKDYSEA